MAIAENEIHNVLEGPVMEVYAIKNGFLLMTKGRHNANTFEVQPTPTLIYAKDEIGIAEEIIAAQARHKLDIEPKQGEMFSPEEMDRRKKK